MADGDQPKLGESKIPDDAIRRWESFAEDDMIEVVLRRAEFDALLLSLRQILFGMSDLATFVVASNAGNKELEADALNKFDGNLRTAMDNVNRLSTHIMRSAYKVDANG